jgi:hypothetical protein
MNMQDLADMMAKGSKARWGNLIGYILLPFTIALQDNPLDYVRQAKATIDRKKLALEAICTFVSAELVLRIFGVKVSIYIYIHRVLRQLLYYGAILDQKCYKLCIYIGQQVAAAITHRILSNNTMAISSLIGPLEEISFYGHPMAYLAPSVYGHPQVSHPKTLGTSSPLLS